MIAGYRRAKLLSGRGRDRGAHLDQPAHDERETEELRECADREDRERELDGHEDADAEREIGEQGDRDDGQDRDRECVDRARRGEDGEDRNRGEDEAPARSPGRGSGSAAARVAWRSSRHRPIAREAHVSQHRSAPGAVTEGLAVGPCRCDRSVVRRSGGGRSHALGALISRPTLLRCRPRPALRLLGCGVQDDDRRVGSSRRSAISMRRAGVWSARATTMLTVGALDRIRPRAREPAGGVDQRQVVVVREIAPDRIQRDAAVRLGLPAQNRSTLENASGRVLAQGPPVVDETGLGAEHAMGALRSGCASTTRRGRRPRRARRRGWWRRSSCPLRPSDS